MGQAVQGVASFATGTVAQPELQFLKKELLMNNIVYIVGAVVIVVVILGFLGFG
jgi:hypothetical protein